MILRSVLILALLFWVAWLAISRTVPRRRWLTALLVGLPLLAWTYRWSLLREQLKESLVALGVSLVLWGGWWLAWGRRLPSPREDTISVWTPDEPFE